MKKYINRFFTFLGYTTFLFLLGAGIVIYIGHRKSQAAEAAVMSGTTTTVVAMTPAKTDTIETEQTVLPDFQPISKPSVSAPKNKPVRVRSQKQTRPSASIVSAQPQTHAAPVSAPTASVKPAITKVKKTKTKPSTSPPTTTTTHADLGLPEDLPRRYQVTDRTASPRTGGSRIPDVYAPPSELERQAMRHAENIRQLEEETAKLRNPPIEQTALMKLFSGGEK